MSRRLLSTARSLHRHNHHLLSTSAVRRLSSKAPQLIEIDLDVSDSDAAKLVKLEELVYSIMANRAAPSWLPFVPGSSYWVPPRPKPNGIANFLTRLNTDANIHKTRQTPGGSFDEFINSAPRVWPSSSYFIHGNEVENPAGNEVENPVQVEENDSEKGDVKVIFEVVEFGPNEDEEN